jgi:peptide/nickel transport system substrate-binding protein
MTELRDALRRLASRGTEVGPEVVYARARQQVEAPGTDGRASRRAFRKTLALVGTAAVALAVIGGLVLIPLRSDRDDRVTVGPPVEEGPHVGGEIVYGLAAETSGGWCLPEAQLTASGLEVASAIYDTLTAPARGNGDRIRFVPYLAQSVEHDDQYKIWTIRLRDGVTFHDGSRLDATVVKNNLDAYRGQYPTRTPLTFAIAFRNIERVDVVDDRNVRVTMTEPWVDFDASLWSNGRAGILAQAQLDSDECDSHLLGTGPFRLERWAVNDRFVAVRNPNYWLRDADGVQLPYLDRITFRPVSDGQARLDMLESGEVDVIHTAAADDIVRLRAEADDLNLFESDPDGDVTYAMLNSTRAPFDSALARLALAHAIDRVAYSQARGDGVLDPASGPFPAGTAGYLEEPGFPAYDLEQARELVAQYRQETGRELTFTILHSTDADATEDAELVQQMAEAAGARVSLRPVTDQATLVNATIGRDFDVVLWRNQPGGNPDLQYSWWHCENDPPAPCDNPLNFGGFNDAEINALLDAGRRAADPSEQEQIYEDLNRAFARGLYNLWLHYTRWTFASSPNIGGLAAPPLPDGENGVVVSGMQPVVGLWTK